MHVAVIDIGKPTKNLGWAIRGPHVNDEGADLDKCIEALSIASAKGALALGFEAPMFVPARQEADFLLKARVGECGDGINRPFSAAAGASVLVTALVVVPYLLARLRKQIPYGTATFDWRRPLLNVGDILLFEAFVTNQKKTGATRHVEDSLLAISEFQRGMQNPDAFESSIAEPTCLSLVGAALLQTGWTTDLAILSQPCLVVRA